MAPRRCSTDTVIRGVHFQRGKIGPKLERSMIDHGSVSLESSLPGLKPLPLHTATFACSISCLNHDPGKKNIESCIFYEACPICSPPPQKKLSLRGGTPNMPYERGIYHPPPPMRGRSDRLRDFKKVQVDCFDSPHGSSAEYLGPPAMCVSNNLPIKLGPHWSKSWFSGDENLSILESNNQNTTYLRFF